MASEHRPVLRPALFCPLAVTVLAGALNAVAGPVLRVEPRSLDLGSVEDAALKPVHACRFVVANDGDEELVLTSVRPTCGCMNAEVGTERLAPGQETVLSVDLDVRNRYGRVRKFVYLHSNAPDDQAIVRLEILAQVPDNRTHLDLRPGVLRFEADGTAALRVRNYDPDTGYRLVSLDLPPGVSVEPEMPRDLGPGQTLLLTLHAAPEALAGMERERFRMETTNPQSDVLAGWLLPPLQPEPGESRAEPATGATTEVPPSAPAGTADTPVEDSPRPAPRGETAGTASQRTADRVTEIEPGLVLHLLRSRTDNTDLVFVDTRSREAFAEGHLEGAEWFPEEQWLSGRELWPERSLLVVVAETEESGRNQGHLFASWGYRAVLVLRGGFRAWQTAFGDRFVATGDPGPPVDE